MNFDAREQKLFNILKKLLTGTDAEEYLSHTKRVIYYARLIGEKENAKMELLIPAVILHDIGRCKTNDFVGHVQKGIELCDSILDKAGYSEQKDSIIDIISEHHNNLKFSIPKSIEGEVLLDADRMEIVGPIGVAWWLGGSIANLKEASELYLSIAEDRREDRTTFFSTKSGEKLGKNGFDYCVKFFKDLLNELSFFEKGE